MAEQRRLSRVAFDGPAVLTLHMRRSAADTLGEAPAGALPSGSDGRFGGPVRLDVRVLDIALAGALVEAARAQPLQYPALQDSALQNGHVWLATGTDPVDLDATAREWRGDLTLPLGEDKAITMTVALAWWRSVDRAGAADHASASSRPGDRVLVGLRLVSIDPDSAVHLRRLVELNLGDASLLERDFSALADGVERLMG